MNALRDLLCSYELYNSIILPTNCSTGVNVRVPSSWQLRLLHTSSRSPDLKQGSVYSLEPYVLNQDSAHHPGHSYSEPCLVPYKLDHMVLSWLCKTCTVGDCPLRSSTMTTSISCLRPISWILLMGKSASFLLWHKRHFNISLAYLWCPISYHSHLLSLRPTQTFIYSMCFLAFRCLFMFFLSMFCFLLSSPTPATYFLFLKNRSRHTLVSSYVLYNLVDVSFFPSGCLFLKKSLDHSTHYSSVYIWLSCIQIICL